MTAAETNGGSFRRATKTQPGENQYTMRPERSLFSGVTRRKGKKKDENDNNDDGASSVGSTARSIPSTIFSGLPSLGTLCVRSVAVSAVLLYVLNQKHLLPLSASRVVSKLFFWPTVPITLSRRVGRWTTVVDDAVVLGGAPFGWLGYPKKMVEEFRVRGVINMCDEYRGPTSSYARLGVEQLRLPTVDHFEPSVEDLKRAVSFISKHEARGDRVYVHCKAGHGRSAAVVYSWLLYKNPRAKPSALNEKLSAMRNVRTSLYKQPNINSFRTWVKNGGMADGESEDCAPSTASADTILSDDETEESGTIDSDDSRLTHSRLGEVSDEDSVTEDEMLDDSEQATEET